MQKPYHICTNLNLNNNFINNGLVLEPTHNYHIANKYYVDVNTILTDTYANTPFVTVGGIIANETVVNNKRLVDLFKAMLYPNLIKGYDELDIEFVDYSGNAITSINVLGYTTTNTQVYCNIKGGDRIVPNEVTLKTDNDNYNVIANVVNNKTNPLLTDYLITDSDTKLIVTVAVGGITTEKDNSFDEPIPIPPEFSSDKLLSFTVPINIIRPVFYHVGSKGRQLHDLGTVGVSHDILLDSYAIAGNIDSYKVINNLVNFNIKIFNDGAKTATIFAPNSLNYKPKLILTDVNSTNLTKLIGIKERDYIFTTDASEVLNYVGYQIDLSNISFQKELYIQVIYRNNFNDEGDYGSFDSFAFDNSFH